MSEEEYYASQPDYDEDENCELPSTFLSDEDIGAETNMIIIPSLKIDLELQIDSYVNTLSKLKTKNQLKSALFQIWSHAESYGAIMERMDKLQTDVETLRYDLEDVDFEIEYMDGRDDEI
ncbi:hypothetical protein [Paenibacillus donghaensis]|uniref:Uncharacterized protein n=1 Tax=Paenibacillus donghaensis TaxID=414771 RepID=A0A2Z2KHK5_9BACL|nr:hypothetical protein [Paenibacillus donghaensis]ASA22743.1 hypothetical protein B9T62_19240 [Paenibacillus donghaensis]